MAKEYVGNTGITPGAGTAHTRFPIYHQGNIGTALTGAPVNVSASPEWYSTPLMA